MDLFTALADPTRREIIETLANKGQLTATVIYDEFDVTPPAISQHLKVLREANLVQVEKRGQQRLYQLNKGTVMELEGWIKKLTEIWDERFIRLDEVLEKEKQKSLKLHNFRNLQQNQ